MAFNGSGVYSLPGANYPAVANTLITAANRNAIDSDIATALSLCLTKDGQQTVTANIPFAGYKLTGIGAAASAGDAIRYEQVVGLIAAAGDILYGTGAGALGKLSVGTAGQVLTTNSGATAPEWSTPTAYFSTGDVKLTLKTTADTGWVLMDDKTIGDASSGATGRANADTVDLFTLLWNNTADAQCAVSTGRGASAAADFAANKTIALPKALGRALAVYGAGSGLTSRVLALAIGDENMQSHTHTGTTGTESASHTHDSPYWTQGTGAGGGKFVSAGEPISGYVTSTTESAAHTHSFTTASTGTGSAQNMQPTVFLNVMIKL